MRDCNGDGASLGSRMILPIQVKMNALFVALFGAAISGLASRLWMKRLFILDACWCQPNPAWAFMALLRAFEFLCKTATAEGFKNSENVLR